MKETNTEICGIYCIENVINKRKYVGRSHNIHSRWCNHKNELRTGKHHSYKLQEDWDKHGEENFIFYILEECGEEELQPKENYWVEKLDSFRSGYNRTAGGSATEQILSQYTDPYFLKCFLANIDSQRTAVACYDKSGYIRSYKDIHEAARDIGAEATNVCKVLKGKHKTCGGYTFTYDDERLSEEDLKNRYIREEPAVHRRFSPVVLLNKDGQVCKKVRKSRRGK